MSPRYVPRRERRELIAAGAQWPLGPAEPDERLVPIVDPDTVRRHSSADPYAPASGFSFFRDLLREADARARSAKALESGALRGRDQGEGAVPAGLRADGSLEQVRERLQVGRELGQYERRDITSAFDVSGGSVHVNSLFATSARAQGTILAALPTQPLPDQGEVVKVPRLTGGSSVAVQASENSAVAEVDPTTAEASSSIAPIASQVDESRQLFERSVPAFDQVMASELGKALAAAVDVQLVYGTNANGQTQGLTTLTGRVQTTYTDASPTPAEALSKVLSAYSSLATPTTGYGTAQPSDYALILHPRRWAWFLTDDAVRRTLVDTFGAIVPSAAVTTTSGAGTNQDEILIVARSEATIYAGSATLRVFPEVGSSTLTVRTQALRYVAAVWRSPNAIAHVTGGGLVAPSL